jgi:branched-chain amino acid transport system substrate-binding protein
MTRFACFKTLFLPALLLLAGCGDPEPVKIGFIAGLSGAGADTGLAARNALLMAVDEVNRQGGIDGHPIELIIRDDEKSGAVGRQHVAEFHELGVSAIIGPIISSVGSGMLPAINEHKIVTISPTVSAMELANKDDHLFRMNSTTRDNARAYAQRQHDLGRRKIALALDRSNAAFTESWANEFEQFFIRDGGIVVNRVSFNDDEKTGFSDPARQLLMSGADGLLLVANGFDSAQLALQIRKSGSTLPIIAAEWAASEELIAMGGKSVQGMEVLQSYDRDHQAPHFRNFVTTYQQRFNVRPGYTSIATHDAATMLFAGLKLQAKDGTPLKEALLRLRDVQGLQQLLTFNEYGDSGRQSFHVVIQNSQFVIQ